MSKENDHFHLEMSAKQTSIVYSSPTPQSMDDMLELLDYCQYHIVDAFQQEDSIDRVEMRTQFDTDNDLRDEVLCEAGRVFGVEQPTITVSVK